jgi:hypothetical protein
MPVAIPEVAAAVMQAAAVVAGRPAAAEVVVAIPAAVEAEAAAESERPCFHPLNSGSA